MPDLRLTWILSGRGWADCTVADHEAETVITASYITAAPEELLTAVVGLLVGESETRAQFEAEPTVFRWIFYREDESVWIRLLQLPDSSHHDRAGTEIWTSWQTVDTIARAVIRCFDDIARTHGESGYHGKWCHPFPRTELEALRTHWQSRKIADPGEHANP
jgi:hypothetical protein